MKRATKILCIIAACLLGSGLLLLCAGLFAGGFHSLRAGALNLPPQGDDIQDSFLFEQVDALSIQCEIGDLSIRTDPDLPAGAVYVEYDLPAGAQVFAQMEETTLAFSSQAPRHTRHNLTGLFQRLLRNLLTQGSLNAYPTAYVHISVSPHGMVSAAQIQLDVGDLAMDGLRCQDLDIHAAVGAAQLSNLHAAASAVVQLDTGSLRGDALRLQTARLSCDVGSIDLRDLRCYGLEAVADAGNIHIQGRLAGDNRFQCDLASLTLETTLPCSDYDLDLQADMGQVTVDGAPCGHNFRQQHANPAYAIQAACDLGSIDLSGGGEG